MGKKKLPDLPPDAPGRPSRDRYREQYGVVVICADEADQQRVYDDLKARGYTLRVVVT